MHLLRTSTLFSALSIASWLAACSSSKDLTGELKGGGDSELDASAASTARNPNGTSSVASSAGLTSTAAPAGDSSGLPGSVSVAPIVLPNKAGITVSTSDAGVLTVLCDGVACACDDGIDNDGDGTVDGFDAECTGPFDADEGTFATGIPGDNQDPKWQDCFFDGNSGAGDDGCRYATGCIDGTLDINSEDCELAQSCTEFCAPLALPGCDCFGCCEVTVAGTPHTIVISDACTTEQIDNAEVCSPCVQNTACANDCGECELCLGKTLEDLPEQCFMTPTPPGSSAPPSSPPDGGADTDASTPPPSEPPVPPPGNVCDGAAQECSTSADCGSSAYCSLGCCRAVVQVL
jgi:hypothetical protein